eukprot:m.108833 g.108833  ORF g.108833 m.108833 type:complete len:485 (-) comp27908_c0_seq1:459-1913(-)
MAMVCNVQNNNSTNCRADDIPVAVPREIRERGFGGEARVSKKAASNPEKDDISQEPLLFQLVAMNNIHAVETLLWEIGSSANTIVATKSCRHDLLLHRAVRCGWVDMTHHLISSMGQANIDAPKRDGATPLFIAAQEGHCELVRLLIGRGADLDLSDEDGISPLYIASYQGHLEVVDILLDAGANPNQLGKDATSPLYIAAQEGYANIVHTLAARGANVDSADKDGTTPLLMASQEGRVAAVAVLLSFGADVSASTSRGVQPVHSAAQNGHIKIFQMLTAYGAPVNVLTQSGTTAKRLAKDFQNKEILRWIDVSASWNRLRMCAEANLYWVAQHMFATGAADQHLLELNDILTMRKAAHVGAAYLSSPVKSTTSRSSTDAKRTALLFQRATGPWGIATHRLYAPATRAAVMTIMLVRQRLNNGHRHPCHPPVPEEMWLAILGFVTRGSSFGSSTIKRQVTIDDTLSTNTIITVNHITQGHIDLQ